MVSENKKVVNKLVEQNQTWSELALIWAGGAIAISGFVVGGTLAMEVGFVKTLLISIVGYLIIAFLMVCSGIQGSDLGRTGVQIAEQVFGTTASEYVISFILVVSCTGWFGFQTNLVGKSFSNFLSSYGFNYSVAISSLIWGIVMFLSAIFGIKLIAILNKIAMPILVVTSIIVIVNVFRNFSVTDVFNYKGTGGSFLDGVSIIIGSLAIGVVISPDYFRFTPKRSNVIKATLAGLVPAGVLMIMIGAMLTLATGESDITKVFMDYSTPFTGMMSMLAATWTTNVTNVYSGGLAFSNLVPTLRHKENLAIAIVGGIGTILAGLGILDIFIPIMSLFTALIPPISGVMIASYWILNNGDPKSWIPKDGVNYYGLISWLLGAIPAATTIILGIVDINISINPLIGIVISFVSYVLFEKFLGKNQRRVGKIIK